ncbi:MAG: hypothetical protein ABI572_03670 [Actinomycetota bacterium]
MRTSGEPIRVEGGVLSELCAPHATEALRLAYLLTGDAAAAEDHARALVQMAGRLLHLPQLPATIRPDGTHRGVVPGVLWSSGPWNPVAP